MKKFLSLFFTSVILSGMCGICEAKVAEKIESLISKERNKILDEVLKACDIECGLYSGDVKNLTRHVLMRVLDGLRE